MDDEIQDFLITLSIFGVVAIFCVLSIAIPILINSKWNIEKELKIKELELKYNTNIILEDE